MEKRRYFYLLSTPRGEEEVAQAEFQALVGTVADDPRLPFAPLAAEVNRAAYVSFCAEHIASSADVEGLCRQIRERGLAAERFAIREERIPHGLKTNFRESVIEIANSITGRPDLQNPLVEFVLVASPKGWHFGRIISKSDRSWAAHTKKLHSYSSSISARMARAMVNMAGRAGKKLLDPCCGAGTILIEAASIGLEAVGCDSNPTWPPKARENTQHFGLSVEVFVADAREIGGVFDAIVTDLPYGRNIPTDAKQTEEILAHLRELAPIMVLVAGQPLDDVLGRLGYKSRLAATAKKGGLVRYFYSSITGRQINGRLNPS